MSRKNYSYALDHFIRVYQTNTNPNAAATAASASSSSEASKSVAPSASAPAHTDLVPAGASAGAVPASALPVYGYQKSPQLNLFCGIASLHHALNKNTGLLCPPFFASMLWSNDA
jgi:hypothetical protein